MEAKELTIWACLEGAKPTDIQIVETEYVSALCREIIRSFPKQLKEYGASDLVVRVMNPNTDPKTWRVLDDPKATLAEVLKGELEVYVELPTAWTQNFDDLPSLAEVLRLRSTVPRAVHTAPIPKKFVGRTEEAKALVEAIKSSDFASPHQCTTENEEPSF